ncbi:hypothetical protein C8R47DRAFT_1200209 [Mycena vitilis]|nr:hypothetical protein C8R47DRAFT_1200209 [Mycena vitilis]
MGATSRERDVWAACEAATTSMPRVRGIDEGANTASELPKVTDGGDEGRAKSTPVPPRNTGVMARVTGDKAFRVVEHRESYNAPLDSDPDSVAPTLTKGCWRSMEPESTCTTSSGARDRANVNQSRPSSRSEERESVTGMLFKRIEMTPTSDRSVRGPEICESSVRSPDLLTQSEETQVVAAWPSNLLSEPRAEMTNGVKGFKLQIFAHTEVIQPRDHASNKGVPPGP